MHFGIIDILLVILVISIPSEMERMSVTYVDTSNISAEMFITVLLFLIVIAPLFSLAILRFFQGKKKAGLLLIISGVAAYLVFQVIMKLFF
ncbi:hypothetical protein J23TS9_56000 [Paenibacillus sp. J23TS9]|nr:hypothetical protein J23TS9_56000 [Paenibacillus sp. J23TS9]